MSRSSMVNPCVRSMLVSVFLMGSSWTGCGGEPSTGDGTPADGSVTGSLDSTSTSATSSADTTSSSAASSGTTSPGTTSAPVPTLDDPYGACAGPMASTECVEAGDEVATCIEREDAAGVPHSTCALLCTEDADCPPADGNIASECLGATGDAPGLCLLDCSVGGANSCMQGTVCVDGDPPLCMWPSSNPGHPDAQSFCETACGPCGATLLLPWPMDCLAGCLADLGDCSEPELQEVFACTGGEACPVGGAVVADCLEPIACVMGSG